VTDINGITLLGPLETNPSTKTSLHIKRLLDNLSSYDEAKAILRLPQPRSLSSRDPLPDNGPQSTPLLGFRLGE
jgi:hypothetical protein